MRLQADADPALERKAGPGLLRGAEWLRALAREGGGDLTSARFERTLRELAGLAEATARGGGSLSPEVLGRILGAPSAPTFVDRIAATTSIRRQHGLTSIAHEAMLDHGFPASEVRREAIHCPNPASLLMEVEHARERRVEAATACNGGSIRDAAQYLRAWREGQALGPKLRDLQLSRLTSPRTPPALLLSSLALPDLVATIARATSGPTMILASPSNHQALKHLARGPSAAQHGQVRSVPVRAPSLKVMKRLLNRAERERIRVVIGVGGGVAQDIAKMVGLGRELYIVPTVVSSDCSSNGRSVIGLSRAFSCETSTPVAVAASLPSLLGSDRGSLAFWTQSGFADLLSELSAELDRPAWARHGFAPPRTTARRALDWILGQFSDYDASTLEKLLGYIHEVGCDDIERGTNGDRVGGEHVLYKTLLEVRPELRHRGTRSDRRRLASHGQICAIGTLVTSHLAMLDSGDGTLFAELYRAFQKLGVPLSWPELESLGVRRNDLERALDRARSPVWPASRLGRDPRLAEDPGAVLDEIFGGRAGSLDPPVDHGQMSGASGHVVGPKG